MNSVRVRHEHIINFFLLLMKACACVAVCPRAALVAKSVCPSCRRLAMSGSNEVQVLLLEMCLTGDTHLSNSLSTDGANIFPWTPFMTTILRHRSSYVLFRQPLLQRPNCTADLKRSGNFKCHMSRIGINLKFPVPSEVRDEETRVHWFPLPCASSKHSAHNFHKNKIHQILKRDCT